MMLYKDCSYEICLFYKRFSNRITRRNVQFFVVPPWFYFLDPRFRNFVIYAGECVYAYHTYIEININRTI